MRFERWVMNAIVKSRRIVTPIHLVDIKTAAELSASRLYFRDNGFSGANGEKAFNNEDAARQVQTAARNARMPIAACGAEGTEKP